MTAGPFYSPKARHRAGHVIVVWALSAIAAGCGHSQAAPSSGTNAVSVIGVNIPDGGTAASDRYYAVVTVQYQTTSDLQVPTTIAGLPTPASYVVFVCLSVDGVRIADTCAAINGSENVHQDVAVQGPDARRDGPTRTNCVVAFMIKGQVYQSFVAGMSVPASTLAKDVKPWAINWEQ